MFCLGCGEGREEKPPKFKNGQIVYHVLDGRKMIVEDRNGFGAYRVRYFNDLGELKYETSLEEHHLTDERPKVE
jgi:uncharacterized protein YodC (DUF2158 family)